MHVFHQDNHCLDYLANEGHMSSFDWTVFDRVSPSLALTLQEEALGCIIPRFCCLVLLFPLSIYLYTNRYRGYPFLVSNFFSLKCQNKN